MKKIVAVFALAFALAFGLTSCGGATPEDFTPHFVGSWELVQIEGGETNFSQDDFDMLKEMGMTCSLKLQEDGTYNLDLFGQASSETWETTSAETATLSMGGQQVEVTLVDDKLILEQAGAEKYTFAKVGAESNSSEAAASGAEGGSTEATTSDSAEEDEAAASSAA